MQILVTIHVTCCIIFQYQIHFFGCPLFPAYSEHCGITMSMFCVLKNTDRKFYFCLLKHFPSTVRLLMTSDVGYTAYYHPVSQR